MEDCEQETIVLILNSKYNHVSISLKVERYYSHSLQKMKVMYSPLITMKGAKRRYIWQRLCDVES